MIDKMNNLGGEILKIMVGELILVCKDTSYDSEFRKELRQELLEIRDDIERCLVSEELKKDNFFLAIQE